jgi:hypothetical protein
MSYDEEQQKRSRVVVETPTARREVVQQQTVRYPQEKRSFSTGMVATVALLAIAVTAIIFLFLTNSRNDSAETNVNVRTAAAQPTPFAQPPVIVQQPMTQPTPIIIQQPPPMTTTAPAPVIIQQPPATTTAPPPTTTTAPPASGRDDASLQQKIDKAFADDPDISAATVDATVINGRVSLMGTVNSEAVKHRAERLAYAVKGVLGVDNKIVVSPATP